MLKFDSHHFYSNTCFNKKIKYTFQYFLSFKAKSNIFYDNQANVLYKCKFFLNLSKNKTNIKISLENKIIFNVRYSSKYIKKIRFLLSHPLSYQDKSKDNLIESLINLHFKKNTNSEKTSVITLQPMVTLDFLVKIIFFYKSFFNTYGAEFVNHLSFLTKLDNDIMYNNVSKVQCFFIKSNLNAILSNEDLNNLSGVAYKGTEKTPIDGVIIIKLVRRFYGPFLKFAIKGYLAKYIMDMVYHNVNGANIDIYNVFIDHFNETEKTFKKMEIRLNGLNIHFGKQMCLIDSSYIFMFYKTLFVNSFLREELEKSSMLPKKIPQIYHI